MAEEELPSKIIKLNPEARRRLLALEKDIPTLEAQVEKLGELLDVSPLREKIEWGKKAAKILREGFIE